MPRPMYTLNREETSLLQDDNISIKIQLFSILLHVNTKLNPFHLQIEPRLHEIDSSPPNDLHNGHSLFVLVLISIEIRCVCPVYNTICDCGEFYVCRGENY